MLQLLILVVISSYWYIHIGGLCVLESLYIVVFCEIEGDLFVGLFALFNATCVAMSRF